MSTLGSRSGVFTTSGGLSVRLRRPRPCLHGSGGCDRLGDDCYALGCAVRTVLNGPTARSLRDRDLRLMEADVRSRWVDPVRTRLVAVLPDDDGFVLGFVLGDPAVPLIDYLHVRGSFCGQGLGTLLAEAMGVTRGGPPASIGLDTQDLSRPEAVGSLPQGLLSSGRWPNLVLRPWRP